jgi:hypothetical protein
VRKVVTYVVAALSLLLAFQAYQNSKLTPATRAMSKKVACALKECSRFEPVAERSTVLSHQYEYATSVGPHIVTCSRKLFFFGSWSCSKELEAGRIGLDRRY